jgi:1-hydroxycarotenoid 3,4-desaturase
MRAQKVIVIGAGIGGLSTAALLAGAGCRVTLLERAATPGGKMRELLSNGFAIDSGPTVMTMRWVFDALFAQAGARFDDYVQLDKLKVLARHAWDEHAKLDLFAEVGASTDAIGVFAGAREAAGYRAFIAEAQRILKVLRGPFLEASKPNPLSLTWRIGLQHLGDLFAIRPFETMWSALARHFRDPRLQQLFGRYATYCGSSPFRAPATLMLVAAVEQEGVWAVRGGMQRLAEALASLAARSGADLRYNAPVARVETRNGVAVGVTLDSGEPLEADAIVCNADPQALAEGRFGPGACKGAPSYNSRARSLSALTWSVIARTEGFPLARHNVFFSRDYAREFAEIEAGAPPSDPTIYVCAHDQGNAHNPTIQERLLLLMNAPARGGDAPLTPDEIDACQTKALAQLQRCGLRVAPTAPPITTTPTMFAQLFPATQGALYGRASHGWAATFQRPGTRTPIWHLYLTGGATHPGPGVPMAALSGVQAAQTVLAQFASTRTFARAAMPGGISTHSATTAKTVSPSSPS